MFIYIIFFILIIILAILLITIKCNNHIITNNYIFGGNNKLEPGYITYSIIGEDSGLDYTQLRKLFNANSYFKEVVIGNSTALPQVNLSIGGFDEKSFQAIGHSAYNPKFFAQRASLKNLLDNHRMVTEKTQLFYAIKNHSPAGVKYIPYTILLSQLGDHHKLFENNKTYVLKKNKGRQAGIKLVNSQEGLNAAIKELNLSTNKKHKDEDGILSEYISNPLTIDGKKFHIRVYFIVYIRWGITYCAPFDQYRIYTAATQYKKDDFLDKNIHISGVGDKTTKRYYYEDVKPFINEATMKEFEECLRQVCNGMIVSGMKPFSEADSAYHTFGADILLTDDNKAYLLEINRRPGFTQLGEKEGWDEYNKDFSYKYFSFIMDYIILPYFGLAKHIKLVAAIANGFHSSLANFSHTIIEKNLYLSPYLLATEHEIYEAKKINFYSLMSFDYILETASLNNIWLIYKNNTIIGYICLSKLDIFFKHDGFDNRYNLVNIKKIKDEYMIQLGISREHQKRNMGTTIVALLIEIYASRIFPKNPFIYFPVIKTQN